MAENKNNTENIFSRSEEIFYEIKRIFTSAYSLDIIANVKTLDLKNPKNELQYQLYKLQLIMEQFVTDFIPAIVEIITENIQAIVDFYKAIAKTYFPKVAHLAFYAKKAKTRKKNTKRLYRLLKSLFKPG